MIAQRDDVAPALPLDTIIQGDALDVLRSLPDNSIDAIVTDPPYGLGAAPDMLDVLRAWMAGETYQTRGKGFMGKAWDAFVPGPEYWRECLRVLKPGGHALVFAGTRTWDVMGLALRLAGFELRDTLQWLYGSGFPKSLDVGKALDKAAGAQRQVVGIRRDGVGNTDTSLHKREGFARSRSTVFAETRAATDAARAWDGWGTALKPAWEPIIVCRKPLSEPTVAANVLRWGVGALNIGASRVDLSTGDTKGQFGPHQPQYLGIEKRVNTYGSMRRTAADQSVGRWPANLLLSHAEDCVEGGPCSLWCPVRELGEQSGTDKARPTWAGITGHQRAKRTKVRPFAHLYGSFSNSSECVTSVYDDAGTAARFFPTFRYVAKASRAERNRGCEGLEASSKNAGAWPGDPDESTIRTRLHGSRAAQNHHPTVKPLKLMDWLITLITPQGGVVLDPFAGSGSTLCAAKAGGWRYVGIEREAEYVAIAEARLEATP